MTAKCQEVSRNIQQMEVEKSQIVFIPGPGMGHLFPAVEFGKLLTTRDKRLSVVYLIINFPSNKVADLSSVHLIGSSSQLSFLEIPFPILSNDQEEESAAKDQNPNTRAIEFINLYKPNVRDAVVEIMRSTKVAALVVDMFAMNMIDVGNELGLPCFSFYASGAGFLGFHLHVQILKDEKDQDVAEYKDTDFSLSVPNFITPVPAKVLPTNMLHKNGGSESVFEVARRIRETKGIILNSFMELENYTIRTLLDQEKIIPRIYPIGPLIRYSCKTDEKLMSWLNDQPLSSVVFLCFGSFGGFKKEQVEEITMALEHCGYKFLWSLRRPRQVGGKDDEEGDEQEDDVELLPQGFLERTAGVGKVIGWAPQVAILSHPSVGAFVSHCGWNSILESLWFGVPTAAWPIYAEQQVNAFEMVVELGLSVEIRMDYRNEGSIQSKFIVSAQEIEKGVKKIMEEEKKNEVRKKVTEMKERSRKAVREEGSSYMFLGRLIEDLLSKDNISKSE